MDARWGIAALVICTMLLAAGCDEMYFFGPDLGDAIQDAIWEDIKRNNPITRAAQGVKDLVLGSDKNDTADALEGNRISDFDCTHIPHSHEDGTGTCVCDAGYVSDMGLCVLAGKGCTFDHDCGTASCSGDTKIVYRCDPRTRSCLPPERVDCTAEYGSSYRCYGGQCIPRDLGGVRT
ncbi:hypothetical protein JXB02_01180 [Candidatus Woesearchaeota archaeon]|nr:hypothetical protein [Candidatus Woesearchaeota archaeon]